MRIAKGDLMKIRSALVVAGNRRPAHRRWWSPPWVPHPFRCPVRGRSFPCSRSATHPELLILDLTKDPEANDVYGALEGLVKYGPDGQPEPDLAESVSTPDATTYIFHLRQRVKFWDGDEMTSADVVNALDYYRRPQSLFSPAYVDVKSVEADGPYTVVVTMTHPDAAFESWLCWESPIFEKKFQEEHPTNMGQPSVGIMGTGAFVLTAGTPPQVWNCRPTRTGGAGPCESSTFR